MKTLMVRATEERPQAGCPAGARRSRAERSQGREAGTGCRAADLRHRRRNSRHRRRRPGSLGPVNLPMPVVADRSVAAMSDFGAGANVDGKHYFGINWGAICRCRRWPISVTWWKATPADGQGTLLIKRGIEVGHIFQLGTKYSEAMKATVQGEDGRNQVLTMGCYGIGVTRVVAAAIEQNHDERGIIWPDAIRRSRYDHCR